MHLVQLGRCDLRLEAKPSLEPDQALHTDCNRQRSNNDDHYNDDDYDYNDARHRAEDAFRVRMSGDNVRTLKGFVIWSSGSSVET